jgi:phospholipid/cholesterol/gamma-HCH transport system substrate-binding protein
MISVRTRIQLLVFVVITLVGVSYVGARYARLDRVFFDQSFEVAAHLPDSGGSFAGGEVTYRGTTIGRVDRLELNDTGVTAYLDIDEEWDEIPADTLVLVGNRSALGEQYIELQPLDDDGPYLEDGSEIDEEQARLPIPTVKLLSDVSTTVANVDRDALQTVVTEMGKAFVDTGDDLGQFIDTSNSFIRTANENFEITTSLIRESRTVLSTQLDKASAIRAFSSNLAAFSTALAGADDDLQRLINTGGATATELRSFIRENNVDLAGLLNNLRTMGDLQVQHIDGIEQILVVYPYVVEGGFSVVAKDPKTGKYDAHFGIVFTEHPLCHEGYEGTDKRPPSDGTRRDMNVNARCTEPVAKTNARGSHTAPVARPAPAGSVPVVATWDPTTGQLSWTRAARGLSDRGSVAAQFAGEESWKWSLLQPLVMTTD